MFQLRSCRFMLVPVMLASVASSVAVRGADPGPERISALSPEASAFRAIDQNLILLGHLVRLRCTEASGLRTDLASLRSTYSTLRRQADVYGSRVLTPADKGPIEEHNRRCAQAGKEYRILMARSRELLDGFWRRNKPEIATALQAERRMLESKRDELRRWDRPARENFSIWFGTTDRAARHDSAAHRQGAGVEPSLHDGQFLTGRV